MATTTHKHIGATPKACLSFQLTSNTSPMMHHCFALEVGEAATIVIWQGKCLGPVSNNYRHALLRGQPPGQPTQQCPDVDIQIIHCVLEAMILLSVFVGCSCGKV